MMTTTMIMMMVLPSPHSLTSSLMCRLSRRGDIKPFVALPYQGVLACPPGHPVFLEAARALRRASWVRAALEYHFSCRQLTAALARRWGRGRFARGRNGIDSEGVELYLFEETCAPGRDRYGYDCWLVGEASAALRVRPDVQSAKKCEQGYKDP